MTEQLASTPGEKRANLVFAAYAASEVDRLKKQVDRLGPVTCANAEPINLAETQYRMLCGSHQALNKISLSAEARGAEFGFPPSESWPRLCDLGKWGQPEQLSALGFELVEVWSATYQIDAGQILHRIQVAGIANVIRSVLKLAARKEHDVARGKAIITALQQFNVVEWQRLKIEPLLSALTQDELYRSAEVVGRHLLADSRGSSESSSTEGHCFLCGSTNVAPIASLVAAAPLALWRSAHQQVSQELAAENRMRSLVGDFESLAKVFPQPLGAAVTKGPASVALDGLGVVLPDSESAAIVADILDQLPEDKGPAVVEWATARFAFLLLRTVAREAVLRTIVQKVPSPYSGNLAQCVVSAFVRDLARVDKCAPGANAHTKGALYWSALARGWSVAWNLIPDYHRCAVHSATSYNI